MWQFAIPALQAVGINAGINLLRGKPLLKNAGTAAITGGTFGGSNSLLGQTQFGQNLFNGAQAIPAAQNSFAPNTIESVMGNAGTDGVFRSKDYFSNVFGNPVYTGNEGLLSQIGTGANSIWDTAKANIPDYVTPQNVMGAANILSGIQPQQPQFAQGGNVRQGQTQGLNVDMGGAKPVQLHKREDF